MVTRHPPHSPYRTADNISTLCRSQRLASGAPDEPSKALIITGPSFSDDIERHRHLGMFGPRHVHLFLIESGMP